ncbi:MAG: hypothetical protein B7Y53_03890, partial [Halothiobacillus sp. 28-55-5]
NLRRRPLAPPANPGLVRIKSLQNEAKMSLKSEVQTLLAQLGVTATPGQMPTRTPISGESLGAVF